MNWVIESESEINNFLTDNEAIYRAYGGELPPPNPETQVISIVPAVSELSNDNFWRLLRSVCTQRGSSPDTFEVLYGVNNTQEEAEKRATPFVENQHILEILKLIQQAIAQQLSPEEVTALCRQTEFPMTAHETSLVCLAVSRKVHFLGIDISSPEKSLDQKVINKTGFVRHILSHCAYARLNETTAGATRSYVDVLDADCFVPSDYYASIEHATHGERSDWFAKFLVLVTPDLPEFSTDEEDDKDTILAKMILYLKECVDTSLIYACRSHTGRLGPGVVMRASALAQVGGYSIYNKEECNSDYIFADKNRQSLGKPKSVAVSYYNSFRLRDNATDGSAALNTINSAISTVNPGFDFTYYENTLEYSAQKFISSAVEGYQRHSTEPAFRTTLAESYHKHRLRKRFFLQNLRRYISTQVAEQSGEHSSSRRTDRETDFLESNPVLAKLILHLTELLKSPDAEKIFSYAPTGQMADDVFDVLSKWLPELFVFPDRNFDVYYSGQLRLSDNVLPLVYAMHIHYPDELRRH